MNAQRVTRNVGMNVRRMARCRARAAFTLIEILVTIVILSTGIVVVLRAFESSVAALGESRDVLYGTMLAREKLADLESSLAEGTRPSAESSGWFDDAFASYRWTVRSARVASVAAATDNPEETAALYEVEVAAWRDGREDRQTLMTYLRY